MTSKITVKHKGKSVASADVKVNTWYMIEESTSTRCWSPIFVMKINNYSSATKDTVIAMGVPKGHDRIDVCTTRLSEIERYVECVIDSAEFTEV